MKDNEPIEEDYYLKYPKPEEAKEETNEVPKDPVEEKLKEKFASYTRPEVRELVRYATRHKEEELQSLRDQFAKQKTIAESESRNSGAMFMELQRLRDQLAARNEELRELEIRANDLTAKLSSKLETKDKEIQQLKEQLQAKESINDRLTKALNAMQASRNEMDEICKQQAQRIKELEEALTFWQNQNNLLQTRLSDFLIDGKPNELADLRLRLRIENDYKRIQWISVKERLPEQEGLYLCYLDRKLYLKPGEIRVGDSPFYQEYEVFKYHLTKKAPGHVVPSWEARIGMRDISEYITHWMYIQKPNTEQ